MPPFHPPRVAREIIDLFLPLKSRGAMIATLEKAALISRATLSSISFTAGGIRWLRQADVAH